MKIQQKMMISSLVAIIGMVVLGIVSYYLAAKTANDLMLQQLNQLTHHSLDMAEALRNDAEEMQLQVVALGFGQIKNHIKLDKSIVKSVKAENQITHDTHSVEIPSLLIGGETVLGNNLLVDDLKKIPTQDITIFQKIDKGLLRISTTVMKADGSRAVGTYIPDDSPVYKAIMDKKGYVGRAIVVGEWYTVAYTPIVLNDEVVGAFFAGTPEKHMIERLRTMIKPIVVGKTGYVYILDTKGNAILHPTLEGKNLIDLKDENGREFIKEMCEEKEGMIIYPWKNPQTDRPEPKLVDYTYSKKLDWIVAAGSFTQEFEDKIIILKNVILATLLIVLILGILIAFNSNRHLQRVVSEVFSKIKTIMLSSQEISKGNMSLSDRTQEQAASLEEAASTLEEITSTVKQNADYAMQSKELSNKAYNTAEGGIRISEETRLAMQEISTSGQKISAIVSMVEEIAFQTNILAINAAIEAAKAGESGKGFAVVAIEVRELAQRASEAAKEIKMLVDESSSKMVNGEKMANESAELLKDIVENNRKVLELMNHIATSTREQHNAIEQLNIAVTKLDSMTQSNASLVEEVAASSETLSNETETIEQEMRKNF